MEFNLLTVEERKAYKQCGECFMLKPLTEFYKNTLGYRGTARICKCCAKKAYQLDKEVILKIKRVKYHHQKINGIA